MQALLEEVAVARVKHELLMPPLLRRQQCLPGRAAGRAQSQPLPACPSTQDFSRLPSCYVGLHTTSAPLCACWRGGFEAFDSTPGGLCSAHQLFPAAAVPPCAAPCSRAPPPCARWPGSPVKGHLHAERTVLGTDEKLRMPMAGISRSHARTDNRSHASVPLGVLCPVVPSPVRAQKPQRGGRPHLLLLRQQGEVGDLVLGRLQAVAQRAQHAALAQLLHELRTCIMF